MSIISDLDKIVQETKLNTKKMVGNLAMRNIVKCSDEHFGVPFDVFWTSCCPDEEEAVGAHKLVLALNSEVFQKLFYNS